ncbi:MAG: hypothetical protein ACYTAS_00365, partial [Planctomycetota bacterium]
LTLQDLGCWPKRTRSRDEGETNPLVARLLRASGLGLVHLNHCVNDYCRQLLAWLGDACLQRW